MPYKDFLVLLLSEAFRKFMPLSGRVFLLSEWLVILFVGKGLARKVEMSVGGEYAEGRYVCHKGRYASWKGNTVPWKAVMCRRS